MKENTALSPNAQAVLDAFTEDNSLHDRKHNHYNTEALAAAIRIVAEQCIPMKNVWGTSVMVPKLDPEVSLQKILAIADELEGSPKENERPDRLIAGDVWEFETEVQVKGKRKPQLKKLQFKVNGYYKGECAWQLMTLDGEHYIYLMELAPQYEEMTYIGRLDSK